ncbi:divalent-cation tolerance protein CutA [Haloplanus sp. GCM10025708]|uniref:divalent-cation tolerance protein CutA n=1 Tax=Haloferacaceae TaxID=1644056 RepID=UPI00361C329D
MPTAYVTAPPEAAADIARTLVEERLAACVNRVPCESTYRWDGAVHDDDEAILFVKTTDAGYDALEARLSDLHPHDVPCIERLDETAVAAPFAEWRAAAVDDE